MSNLLDPAALLSSLPKLLHTNCVLQSPHDAIVALIHTCMHVLSFRLVGTDDADTIATYPDNLLPDAWNARGPAVYTLRYKHEQSSLTFVVNVSKLATRTIINAIAVESDKIASLDIRTDDYTSASFFPYKVSAPESQPLVHGFISSNRLADLVQAYKFKIIQKLVPGLRKEGYTEATDEGSSSRSRQEQPRPQARPVSPARPEYPPFGDQPGQQPYHNPLSIGRRDLDPIPVHPSFAPPPLFGGPSGGDGMIVGPDHPIFRDRFAAGRGTGRQGPWGGDGFLPPMGAPPGARFDPIAPSGAPFGQGRGRGGPFGGIPRAGPRSGDPDNDEFMPPGSSDMFS
ncbi:PI31 proteasome regulator N-terminal-domain-containing protein [Hysterangium stoloniferum]|nr:PI31 proteasome regulator N-terminal-domain-containing protein [Hysterangium stoloniferum]